MLTDEFYLLCKENLDKGFEYVVYKGDDKLLECPLFFKTRDVMREIALQQFQSIAYYKISSLLAHMDDEEG